MKKLILLLLITSFAYSQIPKNEYYRQKYFSNFNTNPDSSYFYGSKLINNLKHEPDTIKAKDLHNFSIYFLYTNQKDSAIHYLKKSLLYGNRINNIKTQITIGGVYKKNGEYELAIKEFLPLIKDQKISQRDLGICYSELGSLFSLTYNFEKAKHHFTKAIEILDKNKQSDALGVCLENFGNFYTKNGLYQKALPLLQKSKDYFFNTKDWRQYYLAEINFALCNISLRNTEKANKSFKEINKKHLVELDDKFILSKYYSLSALIKEQNKASKDSILFYNKQSFELALKHKDPNTLNYLNAYLKSVKNKLELLNSIPVDSIYESGDLIEKTTFLKTINTIEYDTTFIKNKLDEFISLTDSLQYQKGKVFSSELKNAIIALKEKEKNEQIFRKNKIFFAVVILIIILIGGFYFIKLRRKIKKTRTSLEKEKEKIEQEFNKKISISKSSNINTTKKVIELDLINIKLTEELQKFKKDLTKETSKEVLDSHWKKFIERFNLINPEFNERLKTEFPKLTKSDLELCSLLKLNLSNKEIAQILNIEYRSVIVKKQRLKKKLALEKNTEVADFLFTFS